MFRPLEVEPIFLVWLCLVITCVATCQQNREYKLDDYDCECVPTLSGRRWEMHCYTKIRPENRGEPSAISSTTDATWTGPNLLTNNSANVEATVSSTEPKTRTQRIHSTKLSQNGSFMTFPRAPREASVREVEFIGKTMKIRMFTIEYEPSMDKDGPSFLEITCDRGVMEIPGLLRKLEAFNVIDVGDIKFQDCALPLNVTYAQILESPENKIAKFTLISPSLDAPILPKKPFEDYAQFIHEFTVMQTKQTKSRALEDFEDGFFGKFTNLTFLSLTRNKIASTKALQLIPNLKELNLSGNFLRNLTAETFRNLTKLQWLDMVSCRIESIDKDAFATLADLRELDLYRNSLKGLPAEVFKKTVSLVKLSLGLNDFLSGLPENIFDNLRKLENFTCEDCGIEDLKPETFSTNPKLNLINLSGNKISKLDKAIFSRALRLRHLHMPRNSLSDIEGLTLPPQLETLNLESNRLRTLPADLLKSTPNIVSINLRDNLIDSLDPSTFSKASLLERLDLSKNALSEFGSPLSYHMIRIKAIDLSNNRLTTMPPIFPFNIIRFENFNLRNNSIRIVKMVAFRSSLNIDLRENPLETFDVSDLRESYNTTEHDKQRITYTIDGPLKCDCLLLDFHRYFKFFKTPALGEFPVHPRCRDLPQTPFSSVSENSFRCKLEENQGCPQGCSCDYTADKKSIRADCSGQNMTVLPLLPKNITELNLANNCFERVPVFEAYPLLRKIDLSNNRIIDISGLNTQPSQGWTNVSLANNSIRYLGNTRKEQFEVDLAGNRLRCTCDTWESLDKYFKDVDVRLKRGVECDKWVNETYLRVTEFLDDRSCIIGHQKSITRFVITLVTSVAFLIVLLTVLYYKNRRKIIVYMYNYHYSIYLLIWPVDEVENDKMYDAFVSFCDEDLSMVTEMTNELEKPDPVTGEQSYKLCLHYRDWIPCNSIVYNISHSVQNSCRTILVLSENFITSVWLNTEFQTALTQMVKDKSHKLIIIVIGELPSEKKLDRELQALLQNTYLKWGNPRFWDHLRYLLPHKKQKDKGIDKTKAVLNGHPMTRILLESRPTSASVSRTAETLENEKNRLKSFASGGNVDGSDGRINEAYVAISTEDISVHCDSFKDANGARVTSGRHRPSSDNAVRPPRKKDKCVSEA